MYNVWTMLISILEALRLASANYYICLISTGEAGDLSKHMNKFTRPYALTNV